VEESKPKYYNDKQISQPPTNLALPRNKISLLTFQKRQNFSLIWPPVKEIMLLVSLNFTYFYSNAYVIPKRFDKNEVEGGKRVY
jgi:hypothetical protein